MDGWIGMKPKELRDFNSSQAGVANRLFPPQHANEAQAKQGLLLILRRDPQQFGYERSRWTLHMVREQCPWLQLTTNGGLSQLLKRLAISYKRGRDYVHSPDPSYEEKVFLIDQARLRANADNSFVLLYMDEVTYYRQPSVAQAYAACGATQPHAQRSYRSNTCGRVVAVLNAQTGEVTFLQRSRTNIACLVDFWYAVRAAYPAAKEIGIVVDNWPVHFHPDVLAPLQPQNFPFPPNLPHNWPTEAGAKARHDNLPIQLVCLPTYASWLNPIEKLWRWLKQDILHMHRCSDDWPMLKQRIARFLESFAHGSPELLRYVGLLPT